MQINTETIIIFSIALSAGILIGHILTRLKYKTEFRLLTEALSQQPERRIELQLAKVLAHFAPLVDLDRLGQLVTTLLCRSHVPFRLVSVLRLQTTNHSPTVGEYLGYLLNTIIGTWKPYNMVLDGCSELALDGGGRRLMDGYVDALRHRQEVIDAEPRKTGRICPDALNPSVSN